MQNNNAFREIDIELGHSVHILHLEAPDTELQG